MNSSQMDDKIFRLSGAEIRRLMLNYRIKIEDLAKHMGVTQKRVRYVRQYGISGKGWVQDWHQGIREMRKKTLGYNPKRKFKRKSRRNPFSAIQPGDRVVFMRYAGRGRNGPEYKRASGKAVMRGPHGWVLNTGGRHGTPAVVDERAYVSGGTKKTKRNPNYRDMIPTKYSALGRSFDSVEAASEWARQKILNDGKSAHPIDIIEKQDMLPSHVLYTIDPKYVKSAYNPKKKKYRRRK